MIGSIFGKFEDWITSPIRKDLSPLGLAGLVVVFIIAVVWTHDGIRIIQKGLSQ